MLIQALTAADPGGGVTEAGIIGGLSGFDSSFSLSGSSSSSGRGGSGGGDKLGHWPISAFSKDTGWEKSERLKGGWGMRFKNTDTDCNEHTKLQGDFFFLISFKVRWDICRSSGLNEKVVFLN